MAGRGYPTDIGGVGGRPLSEVFGALGPLGKLTLLMPFLLVLALPWWMPSLPARRRLDLFLCLSLLPVVTGGLATWQGIGNARAALDALGPSVGIPVDAVRAELLVPLFAGFFASVLFLGIGFCGELARGSAAGQRLHPVLFAGALAVAEVLAPLAIQAHLSALVILEAHVDSRGLVRNVKVLRGAPLFDQAAVSALKTWRYEPLLVDGKPREFVLTVTMNFNLTTKPQ